MNRHCITSAIAYQFAVYSTCLMFAVGCDQRTVEQKNKATETVLSELGVAPVGTPSASPKAGAAKTKESDITASQESQDPASETNVPVNSLTAPKPTLTTDDPTKPWITAEELPRETWEVQYVGNVPVGFLHRRTEVSRSQGDKVFRNEAESRIRISIKGKPLQQHLLIKTIEKDNGEIISIDGELNIGGVKQDFQGTIIKEMLHLTGKNNGKAVASQIEWKSEYRGPFAVEQSLKRRPIVSMETRKLKYFDPILGKVIEGQLVGGESLVTPTMLGDSRELLEVRNTGSTGSTTMEALMWVDDKGEGYKSYLQAVDVRSFRTDPVAAQLVSSIIELRSIDVDSILLNGPVEKIRSSEQPSNANVFRIKHRTKDPYTYFPSSSNQRVKSVDPRTVDVEVRVASVKRDPDMFGFDALDPENNDRYLVNSDFIPCESPQILKLARALEKEATNTDSNESTILDKVNACRLGLSKRLALKEFDKQIGPLPTVLRSNSANCIEHAILLTSLCRSLKVPARISVGYLFNRTPDEPKMVSHVWVEALIDNIWIPFDSTKSEFPTSIDRIKVSDTDFNNPNPYPEIIRAVQMLADIDVSFVAPADANDSPTE